MLIQIQETHPAAPGKKMAAVVAADGTRYGVWPEKLAKLRIGGTYDVAVESWESNGRTLQKIVKFAPVNGANPNGNGTSAPAASNGAAKANGHSNGHTPAVPPAPSGEAEFVGRALHGLILKGEVSYSHRNIHEATAMLREVWRETTNTWTNGNGGGHG
jgi:hypothetical protein